MSKDPHIIDAEFEVVSGPSKPAPLGYEEPVSRFRKALVWLVLVTSFPNDRTNAYLHQSETWRLPLYLLVNLIGYAALVAVLFALTRVYAWGDEVLGKLLGYWDP